MANKVEVLAPTGNTPEYLAQMPDIFTTKEIETGSEGDGGSAATPAPTGDFVRNLVGVTALTGIGEDKLADYAIGELKDTEYVRMYHKETGTDMVFVFLEMLGNGEVPWRIRSNYDYDAGFRLIEVRKDGVEAARNWEDDQLFHEQAVITRNGRARLSFDPEGFRITR